MISGSRFKSSYYATSLRKRLHDSGLTAWNFNSCNGNSVSLVNSCRLSFCDFMRSISVNALFMESWKNQILETIFRVACNVSKHKRRGKFLKFIFRESTLLFYVYERWQRKTKSVCYGVTSECKCYWFKILRTLAWSQRSNLVNFNMLYMGQSIQEWTK